MAHFGPDGKAATAMAVRNGRIACVKLGYHAEERVALKDVPDDAGRR